ncbi:hypothetical protein INT46_010002 [Mucor plumbeus]|uniref:Uncharacterized protein n=1 Tax=Mucor plumbeus TaxID=97098 RepID=A0A8H7RID5_9FUNG|nr:hypothetical protein INT46_010002 [Mucor plumbeus]
MINRKTKRNSPPPLHMTIASVLDYKFTDGGFAKWPKILQLISPPNKKRRAVALIGQSCENSDEDDENDEDDEEKYSEDEQETVLKRIQKQDGISKQKMLNRRAMYIPNPVQCNDGPKDSWHKWTLYRATYQKLRRNSLPLSEGLHLKKMLVNLQQDESIKTYLKQQQMMPVNRTKNNNNDDEDNIPLGTLLESKKLSLLPARSHSPPMMTATTKPKTFYQHMVVTPPPDALNVFYRQPCYYYNNMQSFPVQFI